MLQYLKKNSDLIVCPPYTHLANISANKIISGFYLGAQNMSEFESGAHTGEISADMLLDLGCTHVIIGHSERRMMNEKENIIIPQKISLALQKGLKVIYCCGENLESRESKQEETFVSNQLKNDLYHLENLDKIIIAYEPIWAIGTGKTATSDQAEAMHAFIRQTLSEKYSNSDQVKILYGGSVKASNASEFAKKENINGVLVGGASLIPVDFIEIIEAFNS